jgi:hypothetical protein
MRSAENRPASGWLTPFATNWPILTATGGFAADSPAMSATVTVRLQRSNETLPWLALAPLARSCANAASTSLAARCCA